MEVSSISASPNFGARIVIQKTGFQNLGKDIIDSALISQKTGSTASSTVTETTIFPYDAIKNFPFARRIEKYFDEIGEAFNRIFHRNIKTSALEGVDTKAVAEKTASASTGSGIISTGIGAYDASLASALDQSVNYPNSIYARSFPEFSVNHFPESVVKHLDSIERSAYDRLWDPRAGAGNECASSFSVSASGAGAFSQGIGFEILTKGKKAFEEGARNFPS